MQAPRLSRPRPRRGRAGFSILEALIAAGVLGIALTALVKLHQSSMRGTVASSRLGDASEVARSIADHFALRGVDQAVGCAPGQLLALGVMPTCANILAVNATAVCSSPQSCSGPQTLDQAVPPGAGNPQCVIDWDINGNFATPPPGGEPLPGRFRIRIAESINPSGAGFRVTAIVCWRDANSAAIRTVVSDRLAIPGL